MVLHIAMFLRSTSATAFQLCFEHICLSTGNRLCIHIVADIDLGDLSASIALLYLLHLY
jgi:hypothetical protein